MTLVRLRARDVAPWERGRANGRARESLDFSTPLGQAVATIMSALAEMELALIRERAASAPLDGMK